MFNVVDIVSNNKLILKVEGRIDSNNAKEVEDKCSELIHKYPGLSIEIDAGGVDYISSAGLRDVLKLIKYDPEAQIVNVIPDVYEIFEMTGFTEMCEIKKAYRVFDVAGCTVIGEGAKGIVYRYNDDTIIKVYKNDDVLPMIERERELAKKAFVLGVPTAISYDVVKVGDRYGSVFELLDCKSVSQLIMANPTEVDQYSKIFATLLKTIHSTYVNKNDMPNLKDKIYSWLKVAKDYLGDETHDELKKLIDDIPDVNTMIHGDFHTKNIMVQNGEPLLIDMDTLSWGHPILELGVIGFSYGIYLDINPDNAINFLDMKPELASQIWDKFLRYYFETEDEEQLKVYKNKIDTLTALRIINHVSKRNENPKYIEFAVNKIKELIKVVDNLYF